jgi:UDP-GlcNAc:undecaprenyl-phosphate/decaprenyl-phosphate GlcNAc-1-phosphate transferase
MSLFFLLKLLLALGASFCVTWYLIPLLVETAHKLNVLDTPDGKLKLHAVSTPYLGGVAIYVGFIVGLALTFPFENRLFLFLVGSTLLLFVGLIDDIVPMKPYQKFFGQLIATFCFLKGGFYLKEAFFMALPTFINSLFWLLISAGWILSVINAFNLVDVMDGLATTLAIMASISFLLLAIILQCHAVACLLASFLGALVAFWFFNKPPAGMYLGDAGSLFIGGLVATIPFMIPWGTFTTFGYFGPIIILMIPLLEVGTLILVRSYKGIPFYQGSPDHFSIYLQKKGWSKAGILLYTVFLSFILFYISVLFVFNMLSFATLSSFLLIFVAIWYAVLLFNGQKMSLI